MESSAQPRKIKISAVLKVLKPLLLLIIPILIFVIAAYLVEERSPEVAKWMKYSAIAIAGFIGLWVAIRAGFFLREVIVLWRHGRELMRQDPLFVVETKMRARLKGVHEKIRRTGKKKYDLPFYAVIGKDRNEIRSLLIGSGLVFPLDLASPEDEAIEGYENWYVGKEAVFADTSSLSSQQKNQRWKIFLKTLAHMRPRAPINGAIVVLPIGYFKDSDRESRANSESAIQKKLQLMQDELQEKFPVYLIVHGIDKLSGFGELFGGLADNGRDQILGWSNPDSYSQGFVVEHFKNGIEEIERRIEQLMLRRISQQLNIQSIDRAYLFTSRFKALLRSVSDSVTRIFNPGKYLDPVSLQGAYFTGGPFGKRSNVAASRVLEGATVLGSGDNMEMDAPTVIGSGANVKELSSSKNWFCRDLFLSKVLAELENVARPPRVIKNQKILKYTAVAILIAQLVTVTGLIISEADVSSNWREESTAILAKAQALLQKPSPNEQDTREARDILNAITAIQAKLHEQGLFNGVGSFGLQDDLTGNLMTVHGAIYNKFFLKRLIEKAENDIAVWGGGNTDFRKFGNKLIEYTRWANPNYRGELSIDAFMNWGTDAVTKKNRDFLLKHFVQKQAEALPRLTDNRAVSRINKALEKINGSTRVTLPLETGQMKRSPGEGEWEWWQRMSRIVADLSSSIGLLLKVDVPQMDTPDSDPNERIYEITKIMGQVTNSIIAMERLREEGQKNIPMWIPAVEDFFSSMKSAAVRWPLVIEAVEKSELRSGYALDKIAVPVLKESMYWVRPLIRTTDDDLSHMLDRIVDEKTELSKREVQVHRNVGQKVIAFFRAFNGYLKGVGDLIRKSGALVSYATYYSGDELMVKLETLSKEINQLSSYEKQVDDTAEAIEAIAQEVNKAESGDDDGIQPKKIKKGAADAAKNALKSALSDITIKKDVLSQIAWTQMSSWIKKWQASLNREKNYLASLYWMEIFDWYKPVHKENLQKSWYAILKMNPFSQKNSMVFVEDINKFLEGWLASVPTELKAVLADESKKNAREIKDFAILYDQVRKFKDQYMPGLRKASNAFVSAVHLMEPNAYSSWQKMVEGAEPEMNWDALEAFSKFKEEYEIGEGIALRNITGSLQELEVAVVKGFEGQFRQEFTTKWNQVIKKVKNSGMDSKFPFVREGESASRNEVLNILSEFVEFGESFGMVSPEGGDAAELPKRSQKTLDSIISPGRRRFVSRCASFKKFLGSDGEQMPELTVSMVAGEIGKHYHWIRMFVGSRSYFDLSVYGDRETRVDLISNVGGVRLIGLDVEKTALAERTLTQGDLGLLQLAYLNGRSIDKERTKWRITSQLGVSSADGAQISFDMIFVFNQPLPQLPLLPQ